MANILRNLKLSRIDLVDAPANPGSRVVLVKRDDDIDKRIRQRNGKWEVTTSDGSKVLGVHESREDALRQLAAIEANKDAGPAVGAVHVNRPDSKHSLTKRRVLAATHHVHPGATAEVSRVLRICARSEAVKGTSLFKRFQQFLKEADAEARRKDAEGARRSFLPKDADAEAGLPQPGEPGHEEGEMSHIDALEQMHGELGKAIDGFGDPSKLPSDHPIHKLREAHEALGQHLAAAKEADAEARMQKEADAEAEGEAEAEGMGRVRKSQVILAKRMVDLEKRAKDAEARAATAEDIAKSERAIRELDSVKVELRKFHHVPVDVEKEAPVFKKLRDSDPAAYTAIIEKMNAAEAIVKTARKLEMDLGSGRDRVAGTGTAWAEIEAEAAKIVAKGESGITKAKAIDKVMTERLDLVKRYYEEDRPVIQVS